MIYILRTLWLIGYPFVYLIESLAFLVGIILYPFIEGYAYIKTGKGSNYHIGVFPEYISKKYGKLKDLIEKQK